MDSVDQTKKTILRNMTTTKVVKTNKEELSNIKSIRQAFQDHQSEYDQSSIRTPKRLIFSSKNRKNVKCKRSELESCSKSKKRRFRSKNRLHNKLPIDFDFNYSSNRESPGINSFKRDFIINQNFIDSTKRGNAKQDSEPWEFDEINIRIPAIRRVDKSLNVEESKQPSIEVSYEPTQKSSDIWRVYKVQN